MKTIQLPIIFLQIIAMNFIILAGRTFAYLTDLKLSFILSSVKHEDNLTELVRTNNINGIQINDLTQNIFKFHIIAFTIGCLISYLILSKRNIKKLNYIIIIAISFLIICIKSALNPLKPLKLEQYFSTYENAVYFNAITFTILSLLFFFFSRRIRLDKNNL